MYDIIIIGGGPAGLTSAIYAKEANKSVLVIEKNFPGGQLNNIFNVTNYPGFKSINGFDLANNMKLQAQDLGTEFITENVVDIDVYSNIKIIKTNKGEYKAKNIIIATGAYARELGVKNEKDFYGKGLSYCATCDGTLYKNKTVAVIGGGNTSIDDCLYLSNLVKKIYLIHRRDEFKATEGALNIVFEMSKQDNKIEILKNSVVTKILGDEKVKQIEIQNNVTLKKQVLDIDGIFVAIGRKPDTEIFKDKIELDEYGFIKTNEYMETSVGGVYAVGDVRNKHLRQIITACADGAIAVDRIAKNN